MNSETRKMLLRSIRASLGRFLAILAITALGVGFYAGLKSSQPDMLRSADDYLRRQRMYDLQLMGSLGLMKSDPAAFRKLPGVDAAEGACFADAYARVGEGEEEVWHFQTLTRDVAVPELLLGRMPENPDECLGDSSVFKEEDLGRHISLTDSNSEDTLEHFAGREFTLVGIARSPRYISLDRGSSELGSGKPAGFVLLPAEAFTDEVYHELLLWLDLPGEIYSEEYSDALRRLRPSVETLLNRRGLLRAEELRRENSEELLRARKELDDGWSEYRLGLQQAAQELAEGEQKLQAAQDTLDAGWAEQVKNEAGLAANYRDFYEQYSPQEVQQYDDATEALTGVFEGLPDNLDPGDINGLIDALSGFTDQLNSDDFLGAVDQSLDLVDRGLAYTTTKMELDMTRSTLQTSRAQLEEAEEQLANGRYEYNQGKEKAERELKEARQKLEDAEKELAEGEAELEDSIRPELFTLDRTSNPGYVTFESDTGIIDAIANAFPVFFVLIAALVCITTMTRMVNDERTLIGTMKAMGFRSGVIMAKYLLYAGSSALLGCVSGFFLGTSAIPYVIWMAYSIMYSYARLRFYFSPVLYLSCLAVAVPGTLLVTFLACRKELSERPAEDASLSAPDAPLSVCTAAAADGEGASSLSRQI